MPAASPPRRAPSELPRKHCGWNSPDGGTEMTEIMVRELRTGYTSARGLIYLIAGRRRHADVMTAPVSINFPGSAQPSLKLWWALFFWPPNEKWCQGRGLNSRPTPTCRACSTDLRLETPAPWLGSSIL